MHFLDWLLAGPPKPPPSLCLSVYQSVGKNKILIPHVINFSDQAQRHVGPIEMAVCQFVCQSEALKYGTSHLVIDLKFCTKLDIYVT